MNHSYLTDEQVAEAIHCSRLTAQRKMASGEIRSAKIAGRRLTRVDWLDAYIEARAEGGNVRRIARRAS